jgi:hypothetical protein
MERDMQAGQPVHSAVPVPWPEPSVPQQLDQWTGEVTIFWKHAVAYVYGCRAESLARSDVSMHSVYAQ